MNTCCCTEGYADGQYVLPPLPYHPAALEPFLDEETVTLHHDRHHLGYVMGANVAAATLRAIALGEQPESLAEAATHKLAFHVGGHLLHCLYWHSLSPNPQPLSSPDLLAAMRLSFGSFDGFCRVFRAVALAVEGSGWAVLGVEPMSQRLIICAVHRHQMSLVPAMRPILVCDVWEHAYYLRYKNNRAAYVEAFIRQVHWSAVAHRFNHYCCSSHE